MDEYAREMMDLKTLVTRALEKKGVLARIRAELRANIFAAIEEEDRALENEENPTFALIGTCNERAKQLHASPTGEFLTALICDYLEWCHLEHTLKVYLPECNLPRGFWKSKLKEKTGQRVESGASKDGERFPLLVEIVESYLKHEQQSSTSNLTGSFAKLAVRRSSQDSSFANGSEDLQADVEKTNVNRKSTGNLPPLSRKGGLMPVGQARNATASTEDSASKVKRIPSMDTNCIETDREDINNNSERLVSIQCDGIVRDNEDIKDKDVLPFMKIPQESETGNKSQLLSSFWRQSTSVTSYDNVSIESLEEVIEEEDASLEKESCSSSL